MILRRLLPASLLATAVLASLGAAPPAPPDFQLNGDAERGKVVYVDFWASWCAPCKQSFPWLNEMHARYREQGLEIVGVNVDMRRGDADQFLAQIPARFTLAFDTHGDTAGRYAAKGMPTSYLVGRDGTIVATHIGFKAEDKGRIEGEIRRALGVN